MELLGKIFGSTKRVKLMRLFLFNKADVFDIDDIAERTRVAKPEARKEVNLLVKIGFLKKKSFMKKVLKKTRSKTDKPEYRSVRSNGFVLDRKFNLIEPLRVLLIETELVHGKDIVKRIRKAGKVKMIVLSGLFIQDDNRELDVLIVGEKLKKDILKKEIGILESEIGRELRWAFFDQAEFEYRLSMYDKLVRDIMENTHKTLINNLS